MFFFSEKKLARKLHEGQVTEKEQMIYLLCLALFYALLLTSVFYPEASSAITTTIYDYLLDFVGIAFTAIAIIYSSFINKSGDNKAFVSRYICISIPLTIKFVILLWFANVISTSLDSEYFKAGLDLIDPALLTEEQHLDQISQFLKTGPFAFASIIIIYLWLIWRYKGAFEIASGRVELK